MRQFLCLFAHPLGTKGMLDCVLSVMHCLFFSLRIIAMFKLCAIFHGLLALPLGIIGILDCLLSVMVCLFSLCKRYAR